jgi:hypothetical protein
MIAEGYLNECLQYFEGDFMITSGISRVMLEIGKDADVIIRNELWEHKMGVAKAINEAFLAGNNDKLQRILKRLELALKNKAKVKEVPISHIKPTVITSKVPGAKKAIIQMLIAQIKELISSEQPAHEPKLKWKGTKIDLIKILDTLYDLKGFEKPDGTRPSKKELMEIVGGYFGHDLKSYDSNLSQAFKNGTKENYIEIFQKMLNNAIEKHDTKY